MLTSAKLIRSATFEALAGADGLPTPAHAALYSRLARGGAKRVITGFMSVSRDGRAAHPGQIILDAPVAAEALKPVAESALRHGALIAAQLAHCGRQTRGAGRTPLGVTAAPSKYFGSTPRVLAADDIRRIADDFAAAAFFAKTAGFSAIQLHAAHGYLIHQFLTHAINTRDDEFAAPARFLELLFDAIRARCGDFPIWIKISGDRAAPELDSLARFLADKKPALIEVSCGTMEQPFGIFRGGIPIRAAFRTNHLAAENRWLRMLHLALTAPRFKPLYNLKSALRVKELTALPVAAVGGFRTASEIATCPVDFASACRPFICEPDFAAKIDADSEHKSPCKNCNRCAISADAGRPLCCRAK
jgi:NADH:flavin oxidoreductases, Old Yellow Enzyme family